MTDADFCANCGARLTDSAVTMSFPQQCRRLHFCTPGCRDAFATDGEVPADVQDDNVATGCGRQGAY